MANPHFEIQVTRNGAHYFITAERSVQSKEQAVSLYEELTSRFPAEEGFEVTLFLRRCTSHILMQQLGRAH